MVNNNAAALVLALAALAAGREVIVSRGELVEIGGSFRIPEILAAAGARLVEVGTTNRTRARRLRARHRAGDRAAAQGARQQLPDLGVRRRGRGAGARRRSRAAAACRCWSTKGQACCGRHPRQPGEAAALAGHPSFAELLAAGCDLVCGSGDKLLGGPQAGLLLGRRELVGALRAASALPRAASGPPA